MASGMVDERFDGVGTAAETLPMWVNALTLVGNTASSYIVACNYNRLDY